MTAPDPTNPPADVPADPRRMGPPRPAALPRPRAHREGPGLEGPQGVLILDKDLGLTSAEALRDVKRRLARAGAPRRVKVGHAGTLDPMATGVLIVLIGRGATRLCERVMHAPKRYLADVDLAHTSDSLDLETPPRPVPVERPPDRDAVARACAALTGRVLQTPPALSALKIAGKSAYKRVRAGETVEMAPREIVIDACDLVDYAWPIARIDVRCGRGTYIRTLAADLGAALGAGGMLRALRRTAVGDYTIDRARRLADLPDALTAADLLPVDA